MFFICAAYLVLVIMTRAATTQQSQSTCCYDTDVDSLTVYCVKEGAREINSKAEEYLQMCRVAKLTRNMSKDCFKAQCWITQLTDTTTDTNQACVPQQIDVDLKCKTWSQLKRICGGSGNMNIPEVELSCSSTPSENCPKKCPQSIRCDSVAESNNGTTEKIDDTTASATTTSASTTSTAASATSTSATTISTPASATTTSDTTTSTATSATSTSDTTTSTATSATTTSDTATSTATSATSTSATTISTPASATTSGATVTSKTSQQTVSGSSGPAKDKGDSPLMGVLVGAVVGGLVGGVVILVVIVLLWRACRFRRRRTEDGAKTTGSRTSLGLIPTSTSLPGAGVLAFTVPDVIKVSAVQQAPTDLSDVYDVIVGGDDNGLGVAPSAGDQGDYVDITDDMTGAAVYSLAQPVPGKQVRGGTPAAEYFVLEKGDFTDDDYNRLARDDARETTPDVNSTYNRLARDDAPETTPDVNSTYNKLARDDAPETTPDVNSTYNRLARDDARETTPDVDSTYNRLDRDDARETTPDVNSTYNRLARDDAPDTTPAVDSTYNRLDRDDAPETTPDVDSTYNRLARDDAPDTTPDVNSTYNTLLGDDTPEYFILEGPTQPH